MTQPAIPLSVLDQRISLINEQIQRLEIERELLRSLRPLAVTTPGSESDAPLSFSPGNPIQSAVLSGMNKPTLTDQVRDFVRRRPGLVSTEIAEEMQREFDARGEKVGGADPRKTLLTTIGNLVTKGRVRRETDGRHYPVP